MAVYLECPQCHRKQALTHAECCNCKFDITARRKKNQVPYWVYLRYRGRQVWERIGFSLTVCREREAELRSQLCKDEYFPLDKATKLKDFFEKSYLPWSKREKRSADKDESRFSNHLFPFFGNIRMAELKPQRIEEFKSLRIGEGAKNATLNRDLALLKAIFNKAAKWGLFKSQNPVSLAGMLPENNEHVAKAMTGAEIERLLPCLPPETRPIFEFCLATGLRIGNAMTLTWQQIDRQAKTISVPKTKSGKPLVIPLNDWAEDVISSVPRHVRSPYVFCRLDGKHYRSIHHGFKAACKRAGLGKYRIHDLRHTAATRLAASGVSTTALRDLMGHSTLAMVQRYSHMGQETLQEMSNRNQRPFGNLSNQ